MEHYDGEFYTLRLFSPIEGEIYSLNSTEEGIHLTAYEMENYSSFIRDHMEGVGLLGKRNQKLMTYFNNAKRLHKPVSLSLDLEAYEGRLWSVLQADSQDKLTHEEVQSLAETWGMIAAGGFIREMQETRILVPDGELMVFLGNEGLDYFVCPEEVLKGTAHTLKPALDVAIYSEAYFPERSYQGAKLRLPAEPAFLKDAKMRAFIHENEPYRIELLGNWPSFLKLKSIKNMVIAEALRLGSHHFLFEENEDGYSEPKDDFFIQEPNPVAELTGELDSDYAEEELKQELFPNGRKEKSSSNWWTDGYIQARNYLYGSDSTLQDFEKAYQKFLQEAEQGNGFAMHDLGRMFADGLGRDADVGLAQKWYEKALEAFLVREESVKKKEKPYLQYRIGKMYASGLGAEQNYEKAAHWFSQAAAMDHKYAQYSLAGLYRRGRGVEQNDIRAFSLYMSSAEQGNPYASLELAKMYRDGLGTEPDLQQAEWRFQNAYSGFVVLEEKSHDDKLQYRIGQMLHTGTGTSKDDEGAARYWEKSAKLGNINAQYALGTLWLETGSGDSGQAVEWLTKAANAEHSAAQYVLGKLYQDGVYFNKDMDQAMKWFRSAAELGNEYAAYRMGCLLLLGEEIPKDVEAAVKWLSLSAEKGNPYAQYRLGMLYLKGEEYSPQVEVAMKWLQQAAEQKNEWAFYQLGKLYLSGEHVTKNVETAVHYLGLCAEKGNQYAQYVLGKLYLCGRDVSRDREKAVEYLTASAEQGNLYASFLLEHLDAYQDPSLFLAATRLLHHLEKLFCEEVQRPMEMKRYQIDRKRRRKLLEKKQAQGHHREDQEPAQGIY